MLQPNTLRQLLSMRYSSQAQAVHEHADSEASPQLVTDFADLPKLGVHESLVNALVSNMKYREMTEVQSLTINPALRGVDL
jgi:ATP-dependent RNA helicase MSS116, mitochondrial